MNHPPAVSVIVPHYGDPEPTQEVVRRLYRATGVRLQVIVVDDASPLAMPELDGALVVRRARNGGFGSAVNSGVAQAVHPLILVLNSDVAFGPTFIADLVQAAEPWQPAVVSPRLVGPEGGTQWPGRHRPSVLHQVTEWLTPLARFRHHAVLHELVGHDTDTVGEGDTPVDWVVGACMLMPSDAYRAAGGLDERFHMNAEEVDLQLRLHDMGLPSVVVDEVTLVHEGGGSSPSHRRRQWLVTGRDRFAAKWGGRAALRLGLTAATAVNVAANTVRQVAGRDVDAVRAARAECDLIWGRRG